MAGAAGAFLLLEILISVIMTYGRSVMKSRPLSIAIIFLFLTPLPLLADWTYIGKSDTAQFYYDTSTIVKTSDGNIRIWVKREFTDQGKQDILKVQKEGGNSVRGYENLKESKEQMEFNCSLRQYSFVSINYHSSNGDVLFSKTYAPDWGPVRPGSLVEVVYIDACKGPK